jgi:acetyl esterase/lipase
MKMLLSLLISMSILTACQRNQAPHIQQPDSSVACHFTNVSYGTDSMQVMDVYLPAGRSLKNTRAMILVHGGGWNGGSKSDFAGYIDSFRRRMPDYAIFNINYRLVTSNHLFPTQEQDVRDAVSFIESKAGWYQFNRNKLVLLGASAGGHLALLQAYKHRDTAVKAVIDFFGPTDLTTMYNHPWHPLVPYALQMVTGTTPAQKPELYRESSPISYVSTQSAPTLIFHGGSDIIVDVSQSKALHKKLEQKGVPTELVVYPGERHGWYGHRLSQSFDRIEQFLHEYVK